MIKNRVVQVRVTPEIAANITTLASTFAMHKCAVVRAMIDLALGNWSPFTAGEAQEVLKEALATEANDKPGEEEAWIGTG